MKMKYVDIAVLAVFVIALVVIAFFWGCSWDLPVTILAGVIAVLSAYVTYLQYKKMKTE